MTCFGQEVSTPDGYLFTCQAFFIFSQRREKNADTLGVSLRPPHAKNGEFGHP
jgi:hypothetical protein